jgi:hypothetical protein
MPGPALLAASIGVPTTVGIVLVEAVVLYVVYGAATRPAGPHVQRLLGGE